MHNARRMSGMAITKEDRAKSDELRHSLRTLIVDLTSAMERSPLITKGDLRDISRAALRMCAALRFEGYTGSMLRRGEPIRAFEAQFILENGGLATSAITASSLEQRWQWTIPLQPGTTRHKTGVLEPTNSTSPGQSQLEQRLLQRAGPSQGASQCPSRRRRV